MERAIGGKLLSPARRHDAVWHLVGLGYCQRFACRIVGLSRSAYRRARAREGQPDKYADLRAWMHEFAKNHRRWGHRRAWIKALAEGYGICRETFLRVWREEALRVLPRKKRKRLAVATHRDVFVGQYTSDAWALDFQFDSTWHNGFVESFHNRMRDELLEDNSIENLEHARLLVDRWSRRYNDFHPHSSLGYLSPRQYAEQWRQENTVNA